MKKSPLALAVCTLLAQTAYADASQDASAVDLGAIQVVVEKKTDTLALPGSQKASDLTVSKERLKHRSATLGNALAGEIGVHSNPFGGGASAPVVRGQDGVRVKILSNGLGVADMAALSPDHAVAVDTLLAKKVEIVRGTSTLLYSAASPAGVVNVVDDKIPTKVPDSIDGESLVRFNSGSDEKLATASIVAPINDKVALRVEGMTRKANPYAVPNIKFGEVLDYLPDSQNKSDVGSVGVSYVGEQGYLGASFSQRRDNYGLVGHNHKLDNCSGHIFDTLNDDYVGYNYLNAYPHLMNDKHLVDQAHFHCGTDFDHDPKASHDHPYGHEHDHTQGGPWVEMKSDTYQLQGELKQVTPTIEKIQLKAGYSDYEHTENDEGKWLKDDTCTSTDPLTRDGRPSKCFNGQRFHQGSVIYFGNQGLTGRLSIYHKFSDKLRLVWGLDSQTNKTYALIPDLSEKPTNRRPLVKNTQKTNALFALSDYKIGNLSLQGALRHERGQIPVEYNLDEIKAQSDRPGQEWPDLTTYRSNATSYSLGGIWQATDKLRLDGTYSHNERIPTPMELYYHGKHLATNSFLYGNKNLDNESSDNFELGASFQGEKFSGKLSVYHNHFDNYIHPENLYKSGNLAMRRFIQSKGKIQGLEGSISYQFHPDHKATIFGDVVRGRLYQFKPIVGDPIYGEPTKVFLPPEHEECGLDTTDPDYEEMCADEKQNIVGTHTIARPDRHVPRLPPARLGFRLASRFGDHWSTSVEYHHVFDQTKTSQSVAAKKVYVDRDDYEDRPSYEYDNAKNALHPIYAQEDPTPGYNLLDLGVDYQNSIGNTDYTVSLRANNLLNEKIYIHNSFLPYVPQMGRNFSLSISTKF